MYPYGHYGTPSYHHMYSHGLGFRRGPSRLIWFFIGAGVATWWIKAKNRDANGESRGFGHWNWQSGRPAVHAPPSPPPMQAEYHVETTASAPPTAPVQATPSSQVSPWDRWEEARHSWHARWQRDEDREQFNKMSKQAADTMADLTEATLESVLSTAEALKVKLAEHRARREQDQKMLEQRMAEQRRSPPRLV